MAVILKNFVVLPILAFTLPPMATDLSGLEWMSGCWSIEGKESGSGEMWTRPMGNMILGVGYISKNGTVSSYEHMRIEKRQSGDVYFVAKPSNQPEAEFKLIEAINGRAVFENPEHDFPQRITYRIESEGVMKARVEAKEKGGLKGFELRLLSSECRLGH